MAQGRDRTRYPWICSQTSRLPSVARHITDCATQPGQRLREVWTRNPSILSQALYHLTIVLVFVLEASWSNSVDPGQTAPVGLYIYISENR